MEVVLHLVRIRLQAIEHPLHFAEHIVKRNEAIGQSHALSARVRDVTLEPQRHVVEADLGVRLHDTS